MHDIDKAQRALTIAKTQYDFILLDGSGSMQDKWWESLEAIDAYIETLKAQSLTTHIHLAVFSDDVLDQVERDELTEDWRPTVAFPFGATFGNTPLYDAINVMCRHLRDKDPIRCSITIVTDGEENGSKFTTDIQAKALLDWCRHKGWSVTFIGCDFNNSRLAQRLGATAAECIGVQKKLLTDAARNLGKKRADYGLYGKSMHFTDDEKNQFGGYLTNQNGGGK